MATFQDSIALSEFRRSTVEDMVERLIALLDDLDGDPDLERECDDEGYDSDSEPDFTDAPADFGYPGPLDADGRDFLTRQLTAAGR